MTKPEVQQIRSAVATRTSPRRHQTQLTQILQAHGSSLGAASAALGVGVGELVMWCTRLGVQLVPTTIAG